jgi:hypothetical protein
MNVVFIATFQLNSSIRVQLMIGFVGHSYSLRNIKWQSKTMVIRTVPSASHHIMVLRSAVDDKVRKRKTRYEF